MSIYSDPPPLRPFSEDKPTLLVCWWITLFATVIILLRVFGRFVRSEQLFKEDKMAALALIPLYLRMGCLHVVLIYGTNNAQLADADLSEEDLRKKAIASGLVLLTRILYAATLWVLKNTILEFFRRLNVTWNRSYYITLNVIRGLLVATFIAVVIADLAECRPFFHYWQVLPDPGGQCRQGYAQLLTMVVCNVFTDLLLVIFPIPVIVGSGMSLTRKTQLLLLFSLSLAPVAVTIYSLPHILSEHGYQTTRSVYASVEILFATVAANALVLGSFVRDRGVKKRRFKYGSVAAGSMERASVSEGRRPTLNKHWGSLEDLARDTGYGVQSDLRESTAPTPGGLKFTPAPVLALPDGLNSWDFPGHKRAGSRSDDSLIEEVHQPAPTTRKVSFFDVGGLLDDQANGRRPSAISSTGAEPLSPHAIPAPVVPANGSGLHRGSTAFLQDIGGLSSTPVSTHGSARLKTVAETQPSQQQQPTPNPGHASNKQPGLVLVDPGGLLDGK